jgi:Tetratricopeptide repeat
VKSIFGVALLVACCVAAGVCAQAPANGNSSNPPAKNKPTGNSQTPAPSGTGANPFPEDESNVPVMPSRNTPDLPPPSVGGDESGRAVLPAGDIDPVRSPDDSGTAGSNSGFSSSSTGIDSLAPGPNDGEQQRPRRGRKQQDDVIPEHHETAAEDENVGKYYLDNKDWRAALSRYQSALVLDPDNPDVYWGLAESEKHLGNFADARVNYEKVIEYDPGSRHAKDAKKTLQEPELANAKPVAQTRP